MNNEPRSEQSITDDEKTRFLIELMLTNRWGDEFDKMVRVNTNYQAGVFTESLQKYYMMQRFCDYMHHLGLIRYTKNPKVDHVFEVSVRGKRFLDNQRRKA